MSDQQSNQIGRWQRQSIRSLHQLCADALRLEDPPHIPPRGLLDLLTGPMPYPDIGAARSALHAHPLYQHMKAQMPRALVLAPSDQPLAEFRRAQIVLRYMVLARVELQSRSSAHTDARTDKRRAVAYGLVERLENSLEAGILTLPNEHRLEMLAELLSDARYELTRPKPRAPKYPAMLGLAYAFARRGWKPDGALLIEVARFAGVQLPERTARDYAKEATKLV